MKKAKLLCGTCLAALLSVGALTACGGGGNNGKDEYDKNGRLILNLKNVYFDQWQGEDNYTEILNEKFGVKIKASNYSYNSWALRKIQSALTQHAHQQPTTVLQSTLTQ